MGVGGWGESKLLPFGGTNCLSVAIVYLEALCSLFHGQHWLWKKHWEEGRRHSSCPGINHRTLTGPAKTGAEGSSLLHLLMSW